LSFIKILKYAYILAFRKRLSFCLGSFEKNPYLLPFVYPPEKFFRSKPSPISRISPIRLHLSAGPCCR
jgi:hypothetical protein